MSQSRTRFIGMEVHTDSIAVAYVAQNHGAEVPYLGSIGTRQCDIDHRIRKMPSQAKHLIFVYAAGPCGSWLGHAPKHSISGGTVRKSRTMKHRHRAAQAFPRVAQSVVRSHCAFGAFYRRLTGRLGPA
jgi:hypothetical protein